MLPDSKNLKNISKDLWNNLFKIYLKSNLNDINSMDELYDCYTYALFSLAQSIAILINISVNKQEDKDYIIKYMKRYRFLSKSEFLDDIDWNVYSSNTYIDSPSSITLSKQIENSILRVVFDKENRKFIDIAIEDINDDSDMKSMYKYTYNFSNYKTISEAYISLLISMDLLDWSFYDISSNKSVDILSSLNKYDMLVNGMENDNQFLVPFYDYVVSEFTTNAESIEIDSMWNDVIKNMINDYVYATDNTNIDDIYNLIHNIFKYICEAFALYMFKYRPKLVERLNNNIKSIIHIFDNDIFTYEEIIDKGYGYSTEYKDSTIKISTSTEDSNIKCISVIPNNKLLNLVNKEYYFNINFTFSTIENAEMITIDSQYSKECCTLRTSEYLVEDTEEKRIDTTMEIFCGICTNMYNILRNIYDSINSYKDKSVKDFINNIDIIITEYLSTRIKGYNSNIELKDIHYLDNLDVFYSDSVHKAYDASFKMNNIIVPTNLSEITYPKIISDKPIRSVFDILGSIFTVAENMQPLNIDTTTDSININNKSKLDAFDEYIDLVYNGFIPKIEDLVKYDKYKVKCILDLISNIQDIQFTDLLENYNQDDSLGYQMMEVNDDIIVYVLGKDITFRLLLSDETYKENTYKVFLLNDSQMSDKIISLENTMINKIENGKYGIAYLYKYGYYNFEVEYDKDPMNLLYFALQILECVMSKYIISNNKNINKNLLKYKSKSEYNTSSKWNEKNIIDTLENMKKSLSKDDIHKIISSLESIYNSNNIILDKPYNGKCIKTNINNLTSIFADDNSNYILDYKNDSHIDNHDKNIYISKQYSDKDNPILTIYDVGKNESKKIDFLIKAFKYIQSL